VYPTLPADQAAFTLKNGDVQIAVVENKEQYEKVLDGDADLERIITMYPDDQQQLEGSNMSFADLEDIGQKNPLNNRSEEHTSELQSRFDLVCRLLLEKKKKQKIK